MKKILALLVCLLIVSISVRADDDRPVRFDQLPVKAQAYVKKYFPKGTTPKQMADTIINVKKGLIK